MLRNRLLPIGVVTITVALLGGGVILAQAQGGGDEAIPSPTPVQTISGDEITVGDAAAADSPVTLVESPVASLSSADLGAVTVEGQGAEQSAGEIKAVKEALEDAGVKVEYRKAQPGPQGSVPIGGTLDPNTAHLYGPYWYNAGEELTISVAWTPASSTFGIGLTSQSSGIFYGCQVSGGAWSCLLQVNQAGWYYPTVWNMGPYPADYNGFVSW